MLAEKILNEYRHIAMVGISANPERDSHQVPKLDVAVYPVNHKFIREKGNIDLGNSEICEVNLPIAPFALHGLQYSKWYVNHPSLLSAAEEKFQIPG